MQKPRKLPIVRIKVDSGRFEVVDSANWRTFWGEPYHLMLTVSWWGFIALIGSCYLVINLIFAVLYQLGGDCIANARPGSFQDTFFFSVQTLASIGYGAMYPKTLYANVVVTLEAILGLIGIAMMTGLAFARFSRPTARVLFSNVAVITSHNGHETLMFRAANQRRNQIAQAQLKAYLLRDEITTEGMEHRRIYDLKLTREHTPNFVLTWTAMHPIDHSSPLYNLGDDELRHAKCTLTAVLSGFDQTVMQTIHARHDYSVEDIRRNHRFVDVFSRTEDGHRHIDYNLFHDVIEHSVAGECLDKIHKQDS